jgi:hypothetical protein
MRFGVNQFLVAVLLVLFLPLSAQATDQMNQEQLVSIGQAQTKLSVIRELAERKLITQKEADTANTFYCETAAQIVGHSVTPEEIYEVASGGQRAAGFGLFLNSVIVLAGIALLLAVTGLIGYYLRDFLKSLPKGFYECLAYFVTMGLLVWAYFVPPFAFWSVEIQSLWLVVPSALAFAGCIFLSYSLHWKLRKPSVNYSDSDRVYAGPGAVSFPTVLSGLCAIAWCGIAICFHQAFPNSGIPHFVAFIAVMALQSFLGFSFITRPGCIAIGWEKEKQVPKSTLASLLILTPYVATNILSSSLPECIRLFDTGCVFMGAFVYYLGLLVISSKWYCCTKAYNPKGKETERKGFSRYFMMQAITIASGLAALYLGSTFKIGSLLGIGGTFFTIYLLEKYYEIPWKGVGWAWSLLGVAIALYFFVGFAGQHPQFFIWGVRLVG